MQHGSKVNLALFLSKLAKKTNAAALCSQPDKQMGARMKRLRELVLNDEFVERINDAFSDLRADFELDLDTGKEKVDALLQQHVDSRQHLDNLAALAKQSSGVIQGLRGTGKTHLMLLARHRINCGLLESRNLCIYVNMKRLSVPAGINQDTFNRIFAYHIYECIVSQLQIELKSSSPTGLITSLRLLVDRDKAKFISGLRCAIEGLALAAGQWLKGSSSIEVLGNYTVKLQEKRAEAAKLISKLSSDLGLKGPNAKTEIATDVSASSESQVEEAGSALRYFDVAHLHRALKDVVSALELKSLIFFVDEWEKIYSQRDLQTWAAEVINKVIDSPINFWIAYVPYRGSLTPLAIGSDLQHTINLDSDLIIESSKAERAACLSYFREFINRRLKAQFPAGDVTIDTLINDERKLEFLVLGSMGNPRDFGTIILAAWQNFKAYRQGLLKQGKPFQYISDSHIRDAVRSDGGKKKENIAYDGATVKVWNRIVDFLVEKNSSHFCILENRIQKDALQDREFSELIYHRLINVRKTGVEQKDRTGGDKLMVLAASYSATQELHDKKVAYVKDNSEIDNRVRRYIFDAAEVMRRLRIEDGAVHPCVSCSNSIDTQKMKAAWESNACPFCGGHIRGAAEHIGAESVT